MDAKPVSASAPSRGETGSLLKLTLTLLLLAVGIVTAGILYFRSQAAEFRQLKEQQITSVVDLKVHDLMRWREERLGDARFYQGNATFLALVRYCLTHPADEGRLAELRSWFGSTRASHGYEVLVLDATGRHPLPLFPAVALSKAEADGVREAQATGKIAFVDFHRNEASGQIGLALLIPLREPVGAGPPFGMLVWRIDPAAGLYPLLRSWPAPSATAEVLLIRREGNEVVFLNELRFRSGTALVFRLPLSQRENPAVQAVLGRNGILQGTDYRGVPVFASAHPVPDSPWILLARVDQAEIFAPLKKNLLEILVLVTALVFGTGASLGLIWHQRSARIIRDKLAATEALRTGEERLRLALSATNQGLYDINLQSGEYVVTAEYARMLGHDPASFRETGAAWRERMHPDDRPRVLRALKEYLTRRNDEYRIEFRQRTQTGQWKWILSLGKLFSRTADGRPLRLLGTQIDITERKHAEAALRESEEKLRQIVELSDQVFYAQTPERELTYLSPQAGKFFECDPAEVRARWREFLTDHPLNAAGLALTDVAIATGRPQHPFQLELKSKSGRRFWAEVRETPVVEAGKTVAIVGALTDITSSRQARELMGLQSAALEATSNSVVITDADGNIKWVNPAFSKVTGYTSEEVLGRNPRILKSGQQPASVYEEMWRTIKAGQGWSGEFINLRKDGSLFTEEVTIAPVRDPAGTVTHFVAVKQDITERRSLEKQLFQTQRLEGIGLLASGIAHDLNNVLAPISLSVEMLRLKFPEPNTRSKLDMIEQACRRGSDIIRQVLTFARGVDGERIALPVDLLVKEMVRLIGETFPRRIEVSYELIPDNYLACGDATQIHQVLLNLAVNARDAMPAGGSLLFSLSHRTVTETQARTILGAKAGDFVVVTVRDTGSGIPPEVLPHIFEPFYTTKPRGKGTGLGLSTVYGIMRSHGGFIEVTSLPAVGTKFMVHLPAADRKAIAAESLGSTPPLQSGHGECILIAEDETMIRDVITAILLSNGFTVIAAVDGTAALQEFHAHRTHIRAVVLDLMMPRLNGDEVARQIHELAPEIPIIISSGLIGEGELQDTAEAMQALGVSQILHKPYTEGKLLKALHRSLHA